MFKVRMVLLMAVLSLGSVSAQEFPWRASAIGLSVASLLVWNPMQLDGLGFDQGSDESFERTRMLWLWNMNEPIAEFGPVTLDGHYEFGFGQIAPSPQNVHLGFTPVLEWQLNALPGSPIIETGLGANWLSLTEQADRQISTHFQFGEVLGVALKLSNWQIGARYQHLSNGDVKQPNNGYNFFNVVVKYWY